MIPEKISTCIRATIKRLCKQDVVLLLHSAPNASQSVTTEAQGCVSAGCAASCDSEVSAHLPGKHPQQGIRGTAPLE